MNKIFYIGQCPICRGYGRLEVDKDISNNEYLIMCDECFAEWNSPQEALKNINGHRENIKKGLVRSATWQEIMSMGWEIFIDNSL